MKKYLLIILLLTPFLVKGINTNGSLNPIEFEQSSSSDNGCDYGYYWGGSVNSPSNEGLRITFFDLNGEQLGTSIDLWDKKNITNNQLCGEVSGTNYSKCKTTNRRSYINGTPSRIEYMKEITERNGIRYVLTTNNYFYYIDNKFAGLKNNNPLWYTSTESNQATLFKNYFTNANNVRDLMILAGVSGIDPSTSGEYMFILEPVVAIVPCDKNNPRIEGFFSVSDYAYHVFAKYRYANNFTLNCKIPKTLGLEKEAKFGDVTIAKPLDNVCGNSAGNYTTAQRTTDPYGIGMFLVYGEDVCAPNCNSNRYQIVYRTISLSNPFLGIDGKPRILDSKSNWYQKENTIDASIYSKKPEYTIVLTPSAIMEIRNDNKTIDYDKIGGQSYLDFKNKFASIFK